MERNGVISKHNIVVRLKESFLLIVLSLVISACNIEANLIGKLDSSSKSPVEKVSRTSPDFIAAEVVTTNLGFQVRGVFGETSEKIALPNGYQVEGVFYE